MTKLPELAVASANSYLGTMIHQLRSIILDGQESDPMLQLSDSVTNTIEEIQVFTAMDANSLNEYTTQPRKRYLPKP